MRCSLLHAFHPDAHFSYDWLAAADGRALKTSSSNGGPSLDTSGNATSPHVRSLNRHCPPLPSGREAICNELSEPSYEECHAPVKTLSLCCRLSICISPLRALRSPVKLQAFSHPR